MTNPSANTAPRALRLDPADNVLVAATCLPPDHRVLGVRTAECIEPGHKVASADIPPGQPIIKFGQIIGLASQNIEMGAHVHLHNCQFAQFGRNEPSGVDYRPSTLLSPASRRTFQGFQRADGRVGTRNTIAVVTTVNCSATVGRAIVARLRERGLSQFPQVDDVVAYTHSGGCGASAQGENIELLQRTLTGTMCHPNVAGVLLLGLGCEANQTDAVLKSAQLSPGADLAVANIQELGGSQSALEFGVATLAEMLPRANAVRRTTASAEHLTLALQCGGSDGYSGITANPALGAAADLLVNNGGTAILSETPEIYGAEQLLVRRAASPAVAEALMERIQWWQRHVESTGGSMDNNPSHGNKLGGLTTILEKSLGAVSKGGTTGLMGVYRYAEPIRQRGLVFMDSPGNDPYSITGQVASGANVVCFTTGRGSVYGSKAAPCLKLCTNSDTYRRLRGDMDVNCGVLLETELTVQQLGQQIFERVLEVASGATTKSEEFGFGDHEFLPWRTAAVM